MNRKANMKICLKWPSGSWEKQVLIFICEWPLAKIKKRPRPCNTPHTFIYSISCLHLPTFNLQTAIVSETTDCFNFFSFRKA